MSIGFKIKKLREQRNVSQYLLANELNISQSELSKIESNQTKKTIITADIDSSLVLAKKSLKDLNLSDFFLIQKSFLQKNKLSLLFLL
ncbi:helix-turn-helix domain-containing protein [Flavobacterium branchiarum]|uniref:Helix-turn-helix domain-containing protein n=1 Tax=Flavobacterium branchiarum TaxID=1114870 RepID=A0ABV5FLV3_9FLAO